MKTFYVEFAKVLPFMISLNFRDRIESC